MKKKAFTIFLIFLTIISCKENNCQYPISEIIVINKASNFYGGKTKLILTDKEKIQTIDSLVNNLNNQKSTTASVNLNNGYLEIFYSTKDCKNQPYLDIIFTEYSGTIIHRNYKTNNENEFYINNALTNRIKSLMKMKEKKRN
ncbi:hypothetical protein [Thalassobellus sediminis]|uniref:hypothetical protein n=1 Tax=Thalassobellus sediminis TaxID=3367753 RepID=UPI0037904D2A